MTHLWFWGLYILSHGTVYQHLRNVYFSRPYILSRGPYISAQGPYILRVSRNIGFILVKLYFTKIFLISPRVNPFHQDRTNFTKIFLISPRFFRFHQESTHFTKWEFHQDSHQDGWTPYLPSVSTVSTVSTVLSRINYFLLWNIWNLIRIYCDSTQYP